MTAVSNHLPNPAPYMRWAKTRPAAKYDLAGSNVLACSIDDLEGAADVLSLEGRNDNGYQPLIDAIASRYGVPQDHVTTAQGTSGANFLAFAALLSHGDDVLIERPGYDPLIGAARVLGANVVRFDRVFEDGYRLDPDRVAAAMTPRTKLIVVTSLHNPSGAIADAEALDAVGTLAASRGAFVLVDEVYLDATPRAVTPAARRGDVFLSTSSLTKAYGLAGLRCGWILSSPEIAERIRRARDVVDGTGSIVAERLAVLAFSQLDHLHDRAVSLLAANRATLDAFLRTRDDLEWVPPAGGTVMFPRIRGVDDVSAFAERLLREHDTAIVPGRFFDAPAHFRLGFATDAERLAGGLAALGGALDGLRT